MKKNYLQSEIEHQMCHFLTLSVKSTFTPFHIKINLLKSCCTLPTRVRLAPVLFVNSSNAAMPMPPNLLSHLKVLKGKEYLI